VAKSTTTATSAENRPDISGCGTTINVATHFRKPTPPLSESFESSPSPKVSQRFDSVLGEDVEEKYGPSPIVSGVESRPEQCQKADEALYWYRAIDRVHLYHRGFLEGGMGGVWGGV